jgi:hypothetical protein
MIKPDPHDYIIPKMPEHITMFIPADAYYPSNISEGRLLVFRLCYTNGKDTVSTYLDLLNKLGFMDGPYYELYPNAGGDCNRYRMHEYDDMVKDIISLLPKVESEVT